MHRNGRTGVTRLTITLRNVLRKLLKCLIYIGVPPYRQECLIINQNKKRVKWQGNNIVSRSKILQKVDIKPISCFIINSFIATQQQFLYDTVFQTVYTIFADTLTGICVQILHVKCVAF